MSAKDPFEMPARETFVGQTGQDLFAPHRRTTVKPEQLETAIPSAFAERSRREAERFRNETDTEYWCAFYFHTRAQKEEFLRKLGLLDLGDKYLDGLDVAERLGVEIQEPSPPIPGTRIEKSWIDLT